MFESVDGRTDRGRLESHPLSSSQDFGSGELKMPTIVGTLTFIRRINITSEIFVFNYCSFY